MSKPGFIVTKEYRRFAEFCDACRRDRYIGLCYGPPGVGKTLSAQHYAQWHVLAPALEAVLTMMTVPTLAPEAVGTCTVLYTPTVTNTPGGSRPIWTRSSAASIRSSRKRCIPRMNQTSRGPANATPPCSSSMRQTG